MGLDEYIVTKLITYTMTTFERTIIDLLCPAIKEKKLIKFWYADKTDDKTDWRTIEPHQIGKLKPKKPGGSESIIITGWFLPTDEQILKGWDENWKNYILERISKIEIFDETYSLTRMGYNPRDDKRCSIVYCATSVRVV